MFFNSLAFLVFFPTVTLVTYLLPKRVRHLWLLIASYYFYMCWNARYALLIAAGTLATYACALVVDAVKRKSTKRAAMLFGLAVNLGMLGFFKYAGFLAQTLNRVLAAGGALRLPRFDILLPVGISFYTFQALGYLLDVYRGEIPPEKSLTRYALFVSFFPQLVAGPIERSTNLLRQIHEPRDFDAGRARQGLLTMLLGFFEKLVIADRAALYVDAVFPAWQSASGAQIALATVVFAFQIYGDFSGYSHIAIGSAKVLGFDLMENFRQPYFAVSVRDFWHRWHISLSTWFRDYLYIPLGGGRKGRVRKAINTLITFTVSGLWHGAALHFAVWGALNGALQVAEGFLPLVKKPKHRATHLARVLLTFVVIDFTWLFFRAGSLGTAFGMLRRMATAFGSAAMTTGFSVYQAWALAVGIAILLALDALHERHRTLTAMTCALPKAVSGALVLCAVLAIAVFGVWGGDYSAQAFIYFQF